MQLFFPLDEGSAGAKETEDSKEKRAEGGEEKQHKYEFRYVKFVKYINAFIFIFCYIIHI